MSTYTIYRTAGEINSAMGRVYGNMSLAVITSMLVSYFVGTSPELLAFFFTGFMKWVVILAPLAAIFAIGFVLDKVGRTGAQLLLHGFAALMGLSFATIFAVFTMGSIVNAFMGAAVLFGVLSFYGYFTKKDLTSVGQFCFVGLIAIIIASLINLVMASFWPGVIDNSLIGQVISAISIVIFLGLTAYDTQKIREEVMYENDGIAEVRGALTLYLDFINLFLSLLNLFGDKK
jgi:FtsH-binding integral membrane protein